MVTRKRWEAWLAVALAAAAGGCAWSVPAPRASDAGGADAAVIEVGVDAAAPDAAQDTTRDVAVDARDVAVDRAPAPCAAPSMMCNGQCVDPAVDPDNCGGCGRVCPRGDGGTLRACNTGSCALVTECLYTTVACPTGNPDTCRSISSETHCGTCAAAQRCDRSASMVCMRDPTSPTPTAYRCCRGVVSCEAGCGAGEECLHEADFDMCCVR